MPFPEMFKSIPTEKLDMLKMSLIILKKLEMNQYLESIYHTNNFTELNFENFGRHKSSMVSYKHPNGEKLIFNYYEEIDSLYKFSFQILDYMSFNEDFIKRYNINNLDDSGVNNSASFKFKISNLNEEHKIQKINDMLNVIYHYYQTRDTGYKYLKYINNLCSSKRNQSLVQYYNIKRFNKLLSKEIVRPNDDIMSSFMNMMNRFVKIIKSKKSLIEINYKNNLYSIMIDYESINIKFGGFSIFVNSFNIDKYKYIRHPGLELFVNLLYKHGELQKFDLNVQKELFKVM